jgi:lipopolysaccharide transport system ATP-binding protein
MQEAILNPRTAASSSPHEGDVVLSVKNVSKKFCKNLKMTMFYGILDLSRNLLGLRTDSTSLRTSEFWAVDDVSFDLRRGQMLGLIGRNGCGKTTLLRLISGIFPPDKGEIVVKGRLATLISLGAGFHPHMTGRENIYLNGAILGMGRDEIASKLDWIIEFSELGEFIDSPVSAYSSGMRVKLGFSIAIAIKPDVLLLDEVLAVGDRRFRAKCYSEMDKVMKETAVIFVSHSIPNISRVCTDALVMDEGKMVYGIGGVEKAIDHYFSLFPADEGSAVSSGQTRLNGLWLSTDGQMHEGGGGKFTLRHLDDLYLDMSLSIDRVADRAVVEIMFFDKEFNKVSVCKSDLCGFTITNDSPEIRLKTKFPRLQLSPGMYSIAVVVRSPDTDEVLLRYHNAKDFQVTGGFAVLAPFHLQAEWSHTG